MTREEIILMAEESTPDQMIGGFEFDYEQLIHFANLVAAAEREECAVIAFNAKTYIKAANAIRARSNYEKLD